MASREYYTAQVAVPQSLPTNTQIPVGSEINSACCLFDKGFTSPPFLLTDYSTGNGVRITFEESPFASSCMCSVECIGSPTLTPPDGVSEQFCPASVEHVYDVDVAVVTETEPLGMLFSFLDSLGNTTELVVKSLVYVLPGRLNMYVFQEGSHYFVELGVTYRANSGYDLKPTVHQYQIEEYAGSEESRKVVVDWTNASDRGSPTHILKRRQDIIRRSLRENVPYGWRIRYRSEYDDASKWSNWVRVEVPDGIPTS